jgi:hypothetical protein
MDTQIQCMRAVVVHMCLLLLPLLLLLLLLLLVLLVVVLVVVVVLLLLLLLVLWLLLLLLLLLLQAQWQLQRGSRSADCACGGGGDRRAACADRGGCTFDGGGEGDSVVQTQAGTWASGDEGVHPCTRSGHERGRPCSVEVRQRRAGGGALVAFDAAPGRALRAQSAVVVAITQQVAQRGVARAKQLRVGQLNTATLRTRDRRERRSTLAVHAVQGGARSADCERRVSANAEGVALHAQVHRQRRA